MTLDHKQAMLALLREQAAIHFNNDGEAAADEVSDFGNWGPVLDIFEEVAGPFLEKAYLDGRSHKAERSEPEPVRLPPGEPAVCVRLTVAVRDAIIGPIDSYGDLDRVLGLLRAKAYDYMEANAQAVSETRRLRLYFLPDED